MKIEFLEFFDIPSATAQQRRHGANGRNWRTPGLKAAQAAWQALFEKYKPAKPMTGPVTVYACLLYHNDEAGAAGRPKTTRPDYDNLAKVFDDALVSAGIVAEDKLIFDAHTIKWEWSGAEMVQFHIENREEPEEEQKK